MVLKLSTGGIWFVSKNSIWSSIGTDFFLQNKPEVDSLCPQLYSYILDIWRQSTQIFLGPKGPRPNVCHNISIPHKDLIYLEILIFFWKLKM